MKMNEIRSKVVSKLRSMLPDETVELEEVDVVKLNDLFHYGIAFRSGDIGKTLYVNDFLAGEKTVEDIADEMLTAYENSVDAPPWELAQSIQEKQKLSELSDNLFVVLLEVARNKNYLQDIPYREVGHGLAYICQIRHLDPYGNGFMSAAVTSKLAESNMWDIDEMFNLAVSNTLKNDVPSLYTMESALDGKSDNLLAADNHNADGLLVLTNKSGVFGAASLFLPGITERIYSCLGTGFFAIPCSIHEIIIVPDSADVNKEVLSAMCREANSTGKRLTTRTLTTAPRVSGA